MEKTLRQPFLKIHPKDNVVVALNDLAAGTPVYIDNNEFLLRQPIAAKHKFFINDMFPGEGVIMYGSLVGKIQSPVMQGSLMTTSNTGRTRVLCTSIATHHGGIHSAFVRAASSASAEAATGNPTLGRTAKPLAADRRPSDAACTCASRGISEDGIPRIAKRSARSLRDGAWLLELFVHLVDVS